MPERALPQPDDERAFYHEGMRAVQDRMDSRRLADRLENLTVHRTFSDGDRALIEAAMTIFVATSDADGWPDCSYKGGRPGFCRVLDDDTFAFASYDGNGQYRTLGNLHANPRIGVLVLDQPTGRRLRINGIAELVLPEDDPALVASFVGAEAVVRVKARSLFPNCPRYLHDATTGAPSVHAPAEGYEPPQPEWKSMPIFSDALPRREGAPGAPGPEGNAGS